MDRVRLIDDRRKDAGVLLSDFTELENPIENQIQCRTPDVCSGRGVEYKGRAPIKSGTFSSRATRTHKYPEDVTLISLLC